MINLAGVKEADQHIARELARARIPVVPATPDEIAHTEVPFTIAGQLGRFRFLRAWYYSIVTGPVPLELALRLYEDPVGKTDIRVGGHCGCPSPLEYGITWRHPQSGKELADLKARDEFQAWAARESEHHRRIGELGLAAYDFVAVPRALGVGTVESYHIDSEVGLRVFAAAVRDIP